MGAFWGGEEGSFRNFGLKNCEKFLNYSELYCEFIYYLMTTITVRQPAESLPKLDFDSWEELIYALESLSTTVIQPLKSEEVSDELIQKMQSSQKQPLSELTYITHESF